MAYTVHYPSKKNKQKALLKALVTGKDPVFLRQVGQGKLCRVCVEEHQVIVVEQNIEDTGQHLAEHIAHISTGLHHMEQAVIYA